MAETALLVTAVTASVAGAAYQQKAQKEQKKAAKEQGRIERRIAEINNARAARRAIAARRQMTAEITAQSANSGTGLEFSSAVRGAVGSLVTQTASNVGAANTNTAASFAYQRAGERGLDRAGRASRYASTFEAVGDIASFGASYMAAKPAEIKDPVATGDAPKSSFKGLF